MKEFLIFGLALVTFSWMETVGQEATGNRHGGAAISMSYSVQTNNNDDDDNDNNNTTVIHHVSNSTGGHVGVWRARGRNRGRLSSHSSRHSLGPLNRRYTARGRRYRARGRRLPVNPTGRPRTHRPHRRRRPNGSRGRLGRRQHQRAGGRLVATGTHSITQNITNQDPGIDPFRALQNGSRQTGPFQDRQTAYDFLSNGGNSFRPRNLRQREMRAENARMASIMCGVFGKQFIPSAIGGRCVDPA